LLKEKERNGEKLKKAGQGLIFDPTGSKMSIRETNSEREKRKRYIYRGPLHYVHP